MASKKTALDSGLTVEWWPVGRPKPYKRNPRRIPHTGIDKVAKSLTEFGWQQPIVVDRKDVIIVGHTRHLAAQQLKLEKVPVVVADLSAAKARAYRLADNRSAEESGWDHDLLKLEIEGLEKANVLDLALFDPAELDAFVLEPADFAPATIAEQGTLDEKGELSCPKCKHRWTPT